MPTLDTSHKQHGPTLTKWVSADDDTLLAAAVHSYIPGCGWTLYQETDDTRVSIVVCNFVEEGNKKDEAVYKTGNPCEWCLFSACIDGLCI